MYRCSCSSPARGSAGRGLIVRAGLCPCLGGLYLFQRTSAALGDLASGRASCSQLGATLATINNADENAFIGELIHLETLIGDSDFWIGLKCSKGAKVRFQNCIESDF